MTRRVCVMFAGNAGTGKDTTADFLARELRGRGVTVSRMAFADPIKDIAFHLLGIPKNISYGTQAEKDNTLVYGLSARHWLQWIGTEVARNQIHPDIWVHRFVDRAIASDTEVVIGSDCRFRNEIDGVRSLLGDEFLLRVYKIVNPRISLNLQHQSESEIFHTPDAAFDGIIHNVSGLSELMLKVTGIADDVSKVVSGQL